MFYILLILSYFFLISTHIFLLFTNSPLSASLIFSLYHLTLIPSSPLPLAFPLSFLSAYLPLYAIFICTLVLFPLFPVGIPPSFTFPFVPEGPKASFLN